MYRIEKGTLEPDRMDLNHSLTIYLMDDLGKFSNSFILQFAHL